jgi:hypothetical protein
MVWNARISWENCLATAFGMTGGPRNTTGLSLRQPAALRSQDESEPRLLREALQIQRRTRLV